MCRHCVPVGVLSYVVDHILQKFNTLFLTGFRTYKFAPSQSKNNSKDFRDCCLYSFFVHDLNYRCRLLSSLLDEIFEFFPFLFMWTLTLKTKLGSWILSFMLPYIFSKLLHLPPIRFHCVGGCWDRARTVATFALTARPSNHSVRSLG
jgi:hypothetical protein